jgi:hypothetical protein
MATPSSHPLRGLLIAQFFGAFNDNAWKLMVALLGIRQALRWKRWRIEHKTIEVTLGSPIAQPGDIWNESSVILGVEPWTGCGRENRHRRSADRFLFRQGIIPCCRFTQQG